MNLHNLLFDTDKKAQIYHLTYLKLTQFSYTKIVNFPDNFMSLNKICNYHTERKASFQIILCLEQDMQLLLGEYFAFSGHPIDIKQRVPINAAHLL